VLIRRSKTDQAGEVAEIFKRVAGFVGMEKKQIPRQNNGLNCQIHQDQRQPYDVGGMEIAQPTKVAKTKISNWPSYPLAFALTC
jgi:hypothetical protein